MGKKRCAWLKGVAAVTLFFVLSSAGWSDVRISRSSSETKKLCYCDCEAQSGASICTKRCPQAKDADRPGAAPCHKKQDDGDQGAPVVPGAHSRKNNRDQQARR
jgi:hypothetical protein